MSVEVIHGATAKPAASAALVRAIAGLSHLRGTLFIGYPILPTPRGRHPVDALLVSPDHGVVAFDLIEADSIAGFRQRQDDTANNLNAKLRTHRELMKGRHLRFPIETASFAPNPTDDFPNHHNHDGYLVAHRSTLGPALADLKWRDPDDTVLNGVLAALESIVAIRKGPQRPEATKPDSRGTKLKRLEDTMATFDRTQSHAVIVSVPGIQRIRGLAGSGKTIVLARKAAYLHTQHPNWRIAVTFNTRSLKPFFTRLINDFHLMEAREPPNWAHLRVLNAWGAPGLETRQGVYHMYCTSQRTTYHDYRSAKNTFGPDDTFAKACAQALNDRPEPQPLFDAILIDEAQDLPPAFMRLCYSILRDNKRLIYAYDELQNLSHDPLPPPDELFGDDVTWHGDQDGQDLILEKCYRNSRPILTTAHALGFGVYRERDPRTNLRLVQMFDKPDLWREVGYKLRSGNLMAGENASLERTPDTSPLFLEEHSTPEDIVQFRAFATEQEQADWVVRQIKRNIAHDEIKPEDIMVINPDPLTTRAKVGSIRSSLLEGGIPNHLAGVDTDPDEFNIPGSVTFSGIHRAKGNEVGMVYVVNAHDCWSARYNLARIRNRLFTAVTRSKAWVRVCGVGKEMEKLSKEFETLRGNGFQLRFEYPTREEFAKLRVVHRDVTSEQEGRLRDRVQQIDALIADLESKSVYAEDIGEAKAERLRELLVVRERRRGSDAS